MTVAVHKPNGRQKLPTVRSVHGDCEGVYNSQGANLLSGFTGITVHANTLSFHTAILYLLFQIELFRNLIKQIVLTITQDKYFIIIRLIIHKPSLSHILPNAAIHILFYLLKLHLHSQLNTWLQWILQRQLQDETRNMFKFWDLVCLILEV